METDPLQDDLPSGTTAAEAAQLAAVADRLRDERPLPSPRFRGRLGRLLSDAQEQPRGALLPRRRALALSGAYSFAGFVLLAISAAGLVGAGPFAPS